MRDALEPVAADLRAALRQFDRLMSANAREAEFQRLFAEHPYILSQTLPLRVLPNDVRPLGRPGRSEPDFVLFPSHTDGLKTYGIVELKRPSSTVLVERRKGLLTLSSDATTAVAQGLRYRRDLLSTPPVAAERLVLIGTPALIFIIMGISDRLGAKLAADLARRELDGLLPGGCHLLPYDVLRDAFSAAVPPRILPLTPPHGHRDLSLLVDLVDRRRFDWSLSWLTDESIEFWRSVENALPADLRQGPPRIVRSEWEITSGVAKGHLASESPNDLLFAGRIVDLVDALHRAARSKGVPSQLGLHSSAWRAMMGQYSGRAPRFVSDEAARLLARLSSDCLSRGTSYAYLLDSSEESAAKELEQAGLGKFSWYDSGEMAYYVHPLVRFRGGPSN